MEKPIVAYHPWEVLQDELDVRGWTQKQFAALLDVGANEINDLVRGRRNITAPRAMKIGRAFGQSAEMRMGLQNLYEIYEASKNQVEIKKLVEIGVRKEAMAFA